MHSPVMLRLASIARLASADRDALAALTRNSKEVAPRRDLVREGEKSQSVHLVVSGWGCRYKALPDGRRQIVGFLIPGDFCDLGAFLLSEMDHSISAITRMRVGQITRAELDSLTLQRPQIGQALSCDQLVGESIQREWTLNIGQRTAYERIAHLLTELFVRLRAVGLTRGDSCDFPLTQTDIADASGLTPVHVNRTLQELRRDGLIELEHKRLRIFDPERLIKVAMFNPNYLHFGGEDDDGDGWESAGVDVAEPV